MGRTAVAILGLAVVVMAGGLLWNLRAPAKAPARSEPAPLPPPVAVPIVPVARPAALPAPKKAAPVATPRPADPNRDRLLEAVGACSIGAERPETRIRMQVTLRTLSGRTTTVDPRPLSLEVRETSLRDCILDRFKSARWYSGAPDGEVTQEVEFSLGELAAAAPAP